jgi:predicted regulator of Ras-like GTPase activity (Roadblock/LC7/MglB family)
VKDILANLNETLGARGSLVVSRDGLLVASDVLSDVHLDRLAAMGAAILSDVRRSLASAGMAEFDHCEVAAEQGKVVLVSAGPLYLLVLVGARIEIGPGSVEVKSAARRVAKAAEFATA